MYVVIMAGGSGTRFWPLSRQKHPKQFLDIIGGKPMLRQTYERISELVPDRNVFVVVGKSHEQETKKILADKKDIHILAEPFGRNTAPCIGLAAMVISQQGNDLPIVILPADHFIAQPDVFRSDIQKAGDLAGKTNCIVTIGIVPVRPETGYGYIERESEKIENGIYRVKSFVEKPDFETAKRYLESGRYFWNAGIFVARPSVLLGEFEKHMPDFYSNLVRLADHIGKEDFKTYLEALYEKAPNISFDYAIMEKTETEVYVVPSACGWSDVGSWYSLYELRATREGDDKGNLLDGSGKFFNCRNCFVMNRGTQWIAMLGLKDVLIVNTDDAILVADLKMHQQVRKITEHLKQSDKDELL